MGHGHFKENREDEQEKRAGIQVDPNEHPRGRERE